MDSIVWAIIMIPVSMLFTGLGIYAIKREKPMWFWSGTTVNEAEISNVAAYNKANGIMWLAFAAMLWIGTILGCLKNKTGVIILFSGCVIGIPMLPIAYGKIYKKYKK